MICEYIKAARTLACNAYAYDAEMKVQLDSGDIIFLHANYSYGDHFTVAKKSFFEGMVGLVSELEKVDFIEEYESLEETSDSKYCELFKSLDGFVDYYINWRKTSGDEWLLIEKNPDLRKFSLG